MSEIASDRLLRIKQVMEIVSLSQAMVYKLCKDGRFPPPYKPGGLSSRWSEAEVREWLAAVLAQRSGDPDRKAWTVPPPPHHIIGEKPRPPLASAEKAAEIAAQIAGVVGIKADPASPVPDDDIALRFPDWPEMMRRRTAAAYLDLTESAFIQEVGRNTLPPPILLGGRKSWSRQQIDRAIAKLLAVRSQPPR